MKKMAVIMIQVTIFMMVIVLTIISGSITTKNINERQRSTLKKKKKNTQMKKKRKKKCTPYKQYTQYINNITIRLNKSNKQYSKFEILSDEILLKLS
jgi:ABC-type dipeptide/oligopeptide/nickel transport system permease component